MKRSFSIRKYLWLASAIIILFSFGGVFSSLRSGLITSITGIFHPRTVENSQVIEELEKLKTENNLLKMAVTHLTQQIKIEPSFTDTVAARIIYRSPEFWNSSCWIDIGESYNVEKGRKAISKGNPVIVGKSLVGIIDHVDQNKSLIKWITDPSVTPSVRVKRKQGEKISYLAKGYLKGTGEPLWRSRGRILEGTGFNYDFADEHGKNRDLRAQTPEPLLLVGDLLVTTGMDGLFPPDLEVAIVTEIKTLREGDYFYEIKATPSAGKMEELGLLFVLIP